MTVYSSGPAYLAEEAAVADGVVDATELAELRRRPDIVMAIYNYGPI